MDSLTSALNWYHKKIGAYDKELWEKSVDRRILRGVCAIPKKSTRIKTELIDVDLVRGSAFAKAKPKHSWISATVSGMRRVVLMPFFFTWWKVQTNFLVSSVLVLLYVLQIGAFFLYFTSDEKELSDVPILEILTPAAMLTIVGIILSQIVATFTSKKSRKHLTRDKRRRVKSKPVSKSSYDRESKSSPESASEADAVHGIFEKPPMNIISVKTCDKPEQSHSSQKNFKSGKLNEIKKRFLIFKLKTSGS